MFIKIDTGADVTTSQDNSINNAWVKDMHFKYLIAYCADMTATNFPSLGTSQSHFRVPFQMLFCRSTRSTLYVDYRHLICEDQLYKVLRILGHVHHISECRIDIRDAQTSFPSLFSGIGKFEGLHDVIIFRYGKTQSLTLRYSSSSSSPANAARRSSSTAHGVRRDYQTH